ncbi:MAG: ATP-binding cassette domain-containing protein [Clostridia bacterium]|nr:ATP-binding cassette domain-containing protein [Oscillospiraceae bacterium]MBQ6701339.1 ATP-binding cassette domain-containing protein [Clostridia bacterium]
MIKIDHLVKHFGDKKAVNDISFTVAKGEIVGFLGPNGAGKSTTMNILTGYLSSTSGSALIDGIDILESPMEAKKLIGFLPELPPLYLDMTVEEYLKFVYDLKDCKLNRKKHLAEICEVVKITHVYKRMIKNLSKGYKQRVGIAQALIGNPKVIIFDEPTIGLDPQQIIEIRNLIRNLGKDHTVILSTHILPEAQAVCDRIIIINEGKVVADEKRENLSNLIQGNRRFEVQICGPQKDVQSALKSLQGISKVEYLGQSDLESNSFMIESEPGVDIRKTLFYALAKNNWPLIGIETMGATLEDIFISLVGANKKTDKTQKSKKKQEGVK